MFTRIVRVVIKFVEPGIFLEEIKLLHIIKGCVDAKRESQKAFYQTYYGFAMGICMRYCNNTDDVQEIVNDGFLKVFNSLEKFNPRYTNTEASLKGWMKRILINTAIDFLRRKNHQLVVVDSDDYTFDVADKTESAVDRMSYQEILQLVQQLSPVYRTVFNMFVIDGFKHTDIAQQLNITVGASKSNLSKARMNIKKMLEEQQVKIYEQKIV